MAKSTRLRVKFWGVRGSIPTPGTDTMRYGGNTPCIELQGGSERIIMDAGTGIRELGNDLLKKKKRVRSHLLLSHTHWDHIQGFPFFMPIFVPGNEIFVYGPRALEKSLRDAVLFQLQYSYFPVRGVELQAKLDFRELDEEKLKIGNIEVETKSMNHPIRVLAYKFRRGSKTLIYTGDNEPYYDLMTEQPQAAMQSEASLRSEFIKECNERVVEFCQNADLLIADSQYTDKEYTSKRGWGHSSVGDVLELSVRAGVKKVVLFHHDPTRNDTNMDALHRTAVAKARSLSRKLKVITAKEGLSVPV
ncbi:MAG: MBL fold metallo-hydrolase [Planctomycetota bacterium]|jgi:phosphoribosyl 1,2-cyclic phosphodiesterase